MRKYLTLQPRTLKDFLAFKSGVLISMRNQDSFSFGASNEFLNPYEQLNSPVLEYETLEAFDTPAPTPTEQPATPEQYPNEIDHEAAARILGLGYSIQGMRNKKLNPEGDGRG